MSSVPVDKRNHFIGYCALQHHGQVRKYTGEPYLFHIRAVAEMAKDTSEFGFEIGMGHDLLEDTETKVYELLLALLRFGYSEEEAKFIRDRIIDLTDEYTKDAYPHLNRKERKEHEAKRLHNIHPDSQSVKYCDLIDNTSSIVEHDKPFAVKYLREKKEILAGMDKGDALLYGKAIVALKEAEKKLAKWQSTK